MRFESKGPPDTADRRLAKAKFFRHHACAPMGGALGLALQSFYHDLLHLRIANLARRSGTRLVIELIDPAFKETLAHRANGSRASDLPICHWFGTLLSRIPV